MDLEEFLKYPVFLRDIDNYFSYCLDNNITFSDKELERLKLLYIDLRDKIDCLKIKKLVILSKCLKDLRDCNFIINDKDISSLNKKDTYINIYTLINCSFDNLFNDDIEMLFYKYLSFNVNNETLNNIIFSVNGELRERLKAIMNDNYNTLLLNIYNELIKSDLDICNLDNLINNFINWKDKCNFCYLNYGLLKKIMKFWNDDLYSNGLFKEYFKILKYRFLDKLYIIMDNNIKDKFIENDIIDGRIKINDNIINKNINYKSTSEIIKDYIIKVNNDYAFSLKKENGNYVLNVFVSNVLDFLLDNKELIYPTYKMGCSLKDFNMLPYKKLYIDENTFSDVFDFKFVFNNNGTPLSSNVKKVKIKASETYNLKNLEFYNEFIEKVKSNSNFSFLKVNNIIDFVSNLVNYYIGYNSSFAIYNNGIYTINRESHYTESIYPTNNFSSIINLVFYLSQIDLIKCDDKYLYKVLDNIDEIINHLNNRKLISDFSLRHPKYINKMLSKEIFLKK